MGSETSKSRSLAELGSDKEKDGLLVGAFQKFGLLRGCGISGGSGKSCGARQEGNPGRAAGPMPAALAPDEGMAVRIPVECGTVDRIDDLLPGLKAPAGKSQ
jgi:hypothetical protein